jgi:hypothetical protein
MSPRITVPGQPPSPNQKVMLDFLVAVTEVSIRDDNWYGLTIDMLTERLKTNRVGGGVYHGQWYAWARSTVRDHLNELVRKELVVKRFINRTAYYVPASSARTLTARQQR